MNIVFSRPKRSDTQPKNGRVAPFVIRSSDSASGSSGRPNTSTSAIPKSRVNAPICDVTISPVVDIIVIIANISQKTGVPSISCGGTSIGAGAFVVARCAGSGERHAASGRRSPCAATSPTSAKISAEADKRVLIASTRAAQRRSETSSAARRCRSRPRRVRSPVPRLSGNHCTM